MLLRKHHVLYYSKSFSKLKFLELGEEKPQTESYIFKLWSLEGQTETASSLGWGGQYTTNTLSLPAQGRQFVLRLSYDYLFNSEHFWDWSNTNKKLHSISQMWAFLSHWHNRSNRSRTCVHLHKTTFKI